MLKGQAALGALWCFAALLSKEEAVLLPFVLVAWTALWGDRSAPGAARRVRLSALLTVLTLVPYFLLRSRTAAYLPSTAPPFYRLSLEPSLLLRNVLEYADRACTFSAALLLLVWLAVRRALRLADDERRLVLLGALWLAGGYGLTVLLPVRSSLYACLPSVGAALAGAVGLRALWRQASERSRRHLLVAAALLPFLLTPLYRDRAWRWVRPAELSTRVVTRLRSAAVGAGVVTVLQDTPDDKINLTNTYGTLIEEAVRLSCNEPGARVWLEPPPNYWESAGLRPPAPGERIQRFVLQEGRLVEAPPPAGPLP